MDNGTRCTIDGCSMERLARGMCSSHYQRWRRGSDLSAPVAQRLKSPEERVSEWTRRAGDCTLWTGSHNNAGYGQMRDGGRSVLVHRWSYEQANGPIPHGLDIDHICHNTLCINPNHLRLATRKQNAEHKLKARSDSRTGVRGVRKTIRGTWVAYVSHRGKYIHVGTFPTASEAGEAARKKRNELYTHNDLDRIA